LPALVLAVDLRVASGVLDAHADHVAGHRVGPLLVLEDRELVFDELDDHLARRRVHLPEFQALCPGVPHLPVSLRLAGVEQADHDRAAFG